MVAYAFTCSRCKSHGDRELDDDWVITRNYTGPEAMWKNLKYPDRCRRCEKHKKRYQRMRRSLERLLEFSLEYRQGYPKMVTVALPSVPDDPRTLEEQLAELKRKWKAFRLSHQGVLFLGGVYATESTLKVNFDRDKGPWFGIKHHVHIHAVVAMPYLSTHKELIEFSESSLKFGLGRTSLRGRPTNATGKSFVKHLAHYLSKYVTKHGVGVRSANFGKLIGYRPPPKPDGKDSTSS